MSIFNITAQDLEKFTVGTRIRRLVNSGWVPGVVISYDDAIMVPESFAQNYRPYDAIWIKLDTNSVMGTAVWIKSLNKVVLKLDTEFVKSAQSLVKNNDGLQKCAWCGASTKKVNTGFSFFDVCTSCGK